MTSATDICNLALTRARVNNIGDYNEQSAEAAKCRVLYPLALSYLISKHTWRFATTTKALALTGNTNNEWPFEYGYPADADRVLYVIPPGVAEAMLGSVAGPVYFMPAEYAVQLNNDLKVIATNLEEAYVAYVKKVTDLNLVGEPFKQALAWYLATDLSIAFGGDAGASYRATALQEYRIALEEAIAADANQAKRNERAVPRNVAAAGGGLGSHYYYNGAFYRRF